MKKKFLALPMTLVLLLSIYTPIVLGVVILEREDYLVFAEVAGPEGVDPAWAYDTASLTLISNVYDTLIRFDVDRNLDPRVQGLLDQFVPALATEWTIEDTDEYDPVADETC